MMKSMTLILGLIIATITTVSCGESGKKPGTSTVGDSTKLSSYFAKNCASCHGSTGGGGPERSIQRYSGSLSMFTSTVRNGKGRMPAVSSSVYSDSDLSADYTYLKSL